MPCRALGGSAGTRRLLQREGRRWRLWRELEWCSCSSTRPTSALGRPARTLLAASALCSPRSSPVPAPRSPPSARRPLLATPARRTRALPLRSAAACPRPPLALALPHAPYSARSCRRLELAPPHPVAAAASSLRRPTAHLFAARLRAERRSVATGLERWVDGGQKRRRERECGVVGLFVWMTNGPSSACSRHSRTYTGMHRTSDLCSFWTQITNKFDPGSNGHKMNEK